MMNQQWQVMRGAAWRVWILGSAALAIAGCAEERRPGTIGLSTADTRVSLMVQEGRLALVALEEAGGGGGWIAAGPGAPSGTPGGAAPAARAIPLIDSAEVNGRRVALTWRLARTQTQDGPERTTHEFVFVCDEPKLELVSTWSAWRGPGPVEHGITITNQGGQAVVLPRQTTLVFDAAPPESPAGHALEQWTVEKGASTPTAGGTHRRAIEAGGDFTVISHPNARDNPRECIPWMSVQDTTAGRGWYAGVESTGWVQLGLRAAPPAAPASSASSGTGPNPHAMPASRAVDASGKGTLTLAVELGLAPEEQGSAEFTTRLAPGETFTCPAVFVGCYRGDVDDGANRLRRWVQAHLLPTTPDARYPLLVNNSWGSGMQVDDALARRMIDESAELGLELFHIDAGWFRTVGDWRPSAAKFPQGLGPIADYAHAKGLKFGLWVAWTQGGDQVDATGGHGILSVRDPFYRDWFTRDVDAAWKPGPFTGAPVCLGCAPAEAGCLATLRQIVKDAKLDLLEHDQIMIVDDCRRTDHRHTAARGDVAYHASQGYYRIYDTLRKENPALLLENCVNGGHTIDYGIVQRAHYISITDTYDPLSNRRAFYDAAYALPPCACECYIENVATPTLANFRAMLRSGMMGWCTIMTDTSKWTPAQHDAAKRQFALYKEKLRPLIQRANLYHISERPDGQRWDGMQYYDPATAPGKGVLFAFRGKSGESAHTFVLKGLDPAARYALSSEDGTLPAGEYAGAALLREGVTLKLPETQSSELVWIERK